MHIFDHTPFTALGSDVPSDAGSHRLRRSRGLLLPLFVAAASVLPALSVAASESGVNGYGRAEANRALAVAQLAPVSEVDGFTRAELNRFATLRDLHARTEASERSSTAELNRFETLRDLEAGSNLDGFARAELNRFETLRLLHGA